MNYIDFYVKNAKIVEELNEKLKRDHVIQRICDRININFDYDFITRWVNKEKILYYIKRNIALLKADFNRYIRENNTKYYDIPEIFLLVDSYNKFIRTQKYDSLIKDGLFKYASLKVKKLFKTRNLIFLEKIRALEEKINKFVNDLNISSKEILININKIDNKIYTILSNIKNKINLSTSLKDANEKIKGSLSDFLQVKYNIDVTKFYKNLGMLNVLTGFLSISVIFIYLSIWIMSNIIEKKLKQERFNYEEIVKNMLDTLDIIFNNIKSPFELIKFLINKIIKILFSPVMSVLFNEKILKAISISMGLIVLGNLILLRIKYRDF